MKLSQLFARLLAFTFLVLVSYCSGALAQGRIYNGPDGGVTRCPAGESGCTIFNAPERIRERTNEGAREVLEADSMRDRVDAVKRTLKDCQECAMDAIRGPKNR